MFYLHSLWSVLQLVLNIDLLQFLPPIPIPVAAYRFQKISIILPYAAPPTSLRSSPSSVAFHVSSQQFIRSRRLASRMIIAKDNYLEKVVG